MTGLLTISFALLLSGAGWAGNLMVCPDCDKSVSRRAVSCPHCGCPGSAIAARVAELAQVAELKTNTLRAMNGKKEIWALPMKMDGRAYAVFPLDGFVGLKSLYFRDANTNRLLRVGPPEMARAVPLVRFPLDESTNRVYWTIGGTHSHTGLERPPVDATAFAGFSSSFSEGPVLPDGQEWESVSLSVFRDALRVLAIRQKGEDAVLDANAPVILKTIVSRLDKGDLK